MAQYSRNSEDFDPSKIIHIIGTENAENYTVYIIQITIGQIKWTVKHRYSEFHELHDKLHNQYKLDKNLLPPKKLFGNQSETFIKKRQTELQQYLQVVLHHLSNLPQVVGAFLDFHKYEIHGLTQCLAEEFYHSGDLILQRAERYHVTPLQLHAITARLKLAEPTCETGDPKKDIGHVLDFVTRLKYMKIQSSKEPIGTSNINMNELHYDLNCFKSLEALELNSCKPDKVCGVEHIKRTLKYIEAHYTMRTVKDILLLDVGFGQWLGGENEAILVPAWSNLESADFSHNEITYLDESVKLMPKVERLDLSHNRLQDVQHVLHLSALSSFNLSHNNVRVLKALHTKLGNIKILNLAGNKLESLEGFAKLYSLEHLDVSHNEISQVLEVKHLSGLPCLENLNLTANPVTIVLDYRTKVLECFNDRAKEVTLDKVKPSQKELDTVAILLALQKSKEAREKNRKPRPAKEATISGPSDATSSNVEASSSSALNTSTSSGITDHDPSTSTSSSLFRIQVEQMRQQGGTAWLTILNQMHAQNEDQDAEIIDEVAEVVEDKPSAIAKKKSPPVQSPSVPTQPPVKQARYIYHGTVDVNKMLAHRQEMSPSSPQSFGSPTPSLMLPETMPSRSDATFVSILQAMLPDTQAQAQKSGLGEQREERPVHLLWASVCGYTAPSDQIPTCVFITTENIHIFHVLSLKGEIGFPDMKHIYCIPLMNVQQIVLGYQNMYIRIEEAFMGPQGTFTLLTASANKTDLFLDALKLAYRRAAPNLDQYEDPHVIVNSETDLNLRSLINTIENLQNASEVRILLYMLVHAVDIPNPFKVNDTFTLVITSRYIYLLREDYVLWPQPTFAIGPSNRPQFDIIHAFPIMGKITGIQMYDTDTYSPDNDGSLSQTFNATNSTAMLVPNFIGYGVKLSFDLSSQGLGQKNLDIRVTTSGMRDKILATLTQARREMSDMSPSPSKMKSRSRGRDSDSASISSGGSARKSKHRSKSKRLHHQNIKQSEYPYDRQPPHRLSMQKGDFQVKTKLVANTIGSIDSVEDTNFVPGHRDSPTGCSNNTESSDDTCYTASESMPHEHMNIAESKDTSPEIPVGIPGPKTTFKVICSENTDSDTHASTDSMTDQNVHQQIPITVRRTDDLTVITDDLQQTNIAEASDSSNSNNTSLAPAPVLPVIRKTPPPNSLNVVYPNIELLTHLTRFNTRQALLRPLSDQMRTFSCMDGEELVNHFHSNVAQIGLESEELHHVLWTEVIPYCNPLQEIPTCVLLSTKAIYFLGEDIPRPKPGHGVPKWKGHNRNKSDSVQYLQKRRPASQRPDHHLSGILHHSTPGRHQIKTYASLPLKDIKEVNIGLFDQCFRLTGSNHDLVFTCVTRNNTDTETFIRKLMGVLNRIHPSPSPDVLSPDSIEQDFYRKFTRQISASESHEYVHASKVKFVYPCDEAVADLTYLITEKAHGKPPDKVEPTITMYTLLFSVDSSDALSVTNLSELGYNKYHPRTLALTQTYISLISEDLVSYPLPSFAKGLPTTKHYDVQNVRSLLFLKRIAVSDFTSNDMTLIFVDEAEVVSVDSTIDYYTKSSSHVATVGQVVEEVAWVLVLQNLPDKDRLIKTICRLWALLHEGSELSVQVTD